MDYQECKTNFNELLLSDPDAFDHCINLFKQKPTDIYTDLLNGHCIKITNKKTTYYNKIHDPTPVMENFKKLLGESNPVYLNFIEYCNPSISEKCCNCISVSLYILNLENYSYLSRFIFTIEQSILNIATFLPGWVYRLYLDPSVFEAIAAVKTKADAEIENKQKYEDLYELYVRTMRAIAASPNCEIYLTSCSDYTGDHSTAGKRRISRFTALIEDDVNINACREADGLIDVIDCYNLKIFETLPIATFAYHTHSMPGKSYYVQTGRSIRNLIFSFSAGIFASKFKINSTIFDQVNQSVLNNYKKINNRDFKTYDEHFLMELFHIFSNNTSYVHEIEYLFGILPMYSRDNIDPLNKYHVNIDEAQLEKLTHGSISTITMDNIIEGTIYMHINNDVKYKNDNVLLNAVMYFSQNKDDFAYIFVFGCLLRLYILYCDDFFSHIQHIKTSQIDKFIVHHLLLDSLNITTGVATLLVETPSNFNDILLKMFVHISKNMRTTYSMIGGSKITDIYFNKYLKYKLKYLNIKKTNK